MDTAPQEDTHRTQSIARRWFPPWSERKRMLRRDAWVVAVAATVLIIFAYVWPTDFRKVSPVHVWVAWAAFMIRTFMFALGLIVLAVVLFAVWLRAWRLLVVSIPAILATLGPTVWQYRPRSEPHVASETATIMSVNLLMINRETKAMIDEIRAVHPDVLLLQEYTQHWHQALQSALGREYPYMANERREDSFGAAIYSRKPFEESVGMNVPLGSGDVPQMRAVIRIADRPVAFYNIHLLPPYGFNYIVETRTQFADLLEVLSAEPLPVVLAGDFNFTGRSRQAAALKRSGFIDAHTVGGWGRGATWPANGFFRWIPGIRLDQLHMSRNLTCVSCRTGVGAGSDHRPVIAKIGFRQ